MIITQPQLYLALMSREPWHPRAADWRKLRSALAKIRDIVTADAPADEVEIANIAYLALAERPRNCGECAKFRECKGDGYDGHCDNWAGVPLRKTDVCHPNMGIKKGANNGK